MSFYSPEEQQKTAWLKVLLAKDETRHYETWNHLSVLPKSWNAQTQKNAMKQLMYSFNEKPR